MCTRMVARRGLLALIASAVVMIPATAGGVEDPTGTMASANVSLLATIPNPGVIGARFDRGVMYVTGLGGLTTYDISDPAAPAQLGTLALPHFENEDVDLGGDILLISNDAAESTGILYVVDVSDPAQPALLSTHQMGGNPLFGGPGHTASCILACRFAWVTDGGGIRVIDLRVPAAPVNLGTFATPVGGLAAHDVQVDRAGIAWVAGFDGTAGYRIPSNYARAVTQTFDMTAYHDGLLAARTDPAASQSTYDDFGSGDELGLGDGGNLNDFIHHNSRRLGRDDVVFITEEDYTRPGCRGAGSFQTWSLPLVEKKRKPTGQDLQPMDSWTTELLADAAQPAAVCSAHYFDVRKNVVAQGWYEQGVRLLDVHDPSDIRQIGYFIPPTSATWAAYFAPTDPAGRILYSLDAGRGIDILEFDRPTIGPLSERGGRCKGMSQKECAEHTAPTVTAPIKMEWQAVAPTTGAASPTFGYACRISL